MARGGRGRRNAGGGRGFSGGAANAPDQFTGRSGPRPIRTAAGGSRARGGGLAAPARRARGSAARGTGLVAPARVINVVGGATAAGGTGVRGRGRTLRVRSGQRAARTTRYSGIVGDINAGRTVRRGVAGGTAAGGAIAAGGATAAGGTAGLVRVGNDPYRRSSAIVTASQAGARGRRRGSGPRRAAPQTPTNAGGRNPSRRAAAIRELARRGATPGERAAAQAAAQRLGL